MEIGWKGWKDRNKTKRMTIPFCVVLTRNYVKWFTYSNKNKINKDWKREMQLSAEADEHQCISNEYHNQTYW